MQGRHEFAHDHGACRKLSDLYRATGCGQCIGPGDFRPREIDPSQSCGQGRQGHLTDRMMVVVAAKADELQRIGRQRLQREDALDPAKSRVRDVRMLDELEDHTDLSAAAEGHDYQMAKAQRELASAVVKRRGDRDIERNPCNCHGSMREEGAAV